MKPFGKNRRQKYSKLTMRVSNGLLLLMSCCSGIVQARVDGYFSFDLQTIDLTYEKELSDEIRENENYNHQRQVDIDKAIFELTGRGWAYHPALMIFNVGLMPEFKQQTVDSKNNSQQTVSREIDLQTVNYHFNATVLPRKPYRINLSGNKSTSEFSSSSSTDSTSSSTNYQASMNFSEIAMPTRIMFTSRQSESESLFTTSYDSRTFQVLSNQETDQRKTDLELLVSEQEKGIRGDTFNTSSRIFSAKNRQQFSNIINLSSHLRYSANSSKHRDLSNASFSNTLELDHTDKFSTFYSANFQQQQRDSFSSDTKSASAGLSHQLYENLSSNLNILKADSQTTSGESSHLRATANFNYTRSIPWGRISANYSIWRAENENKAKSQLDHILGEEIQLSTSASISFLSRAEIDIDSIRVFNLTRTREYIEGIDYTLTVVDGNVGVVLGTFGEIEEGQQLRVDYQYQFNSSYKITNRGDSYGVRLALWEKLNVYYNYNSNQAELIWGISNANFDRNFSRTFGGQLNLGWSTTTIEFQERVGRVHSKRMSFLQSAQHQFNHRWSAGLGVNYSETELVDRNELIESRGFSGHLAWIISRVSKLNLKFYSQESKSIFRDSKNNQAAAELLTRFGTWYLRASYIYNDNMDSVENNEQLQDRNNLLISLTRRFW